MRNRKQKIGEITLSNFIGRICRDGPAKKYRNKAEMNKKEKPGFFVYVIS